METTKEVCNRKLLDLMSEMQSWVKNFNAAFFTEEPIPLPILTYWSTDAYSLGYYSIEDNKTRDKHWFTLSNHRLEQPYWELLSMLLHNMVHSWEEIYLSNPGNTKNWYHSRAFRDAMSNLGVYCNEKGYLTGLNMDGPFVSHLKQCGVVLEGIDDLSYANQGNIVNFDLEARKKKGTSKLKKWSCSCTNVRCAVQLQAVCVNCGERFEKQE